VAEPPKRPDTPELEVEDDRKCADCGKVIPDGNAWQRSDLSALVCEDCSASSGDWQCDQCCYMRAEWEEQFEQDDGSVICEGCHGTNEFREFGNPTIHIRIRLEPEPLGEADRAGRVESE
jgi:hypothetical protein